MFKRMLISLALLSLPVLAAAGENGPLHIAAEHASDPAEIERLVQEGASLTEAGLEGLTPLMLASAYNPNPAVVEALIRAGASLDVRDGSGRTPLHLAAAMNESPQVAASLLRHGASARSRDNEGRTPLWLAAARSDAPVVELLLDAGAPVDDPNRDGVTPLQEACLRPDAATVRLLVEAGADTNRRDLQRYTPTMRAVAAGADADVLRALMDGKADLLAEDDQNRSALFLAVSNPSVSTDVTALLLDAEGPNVRESGLMTPLMEACRAGNLPAVRLLLSRGADLSLRDKNDWTALMFALHAGAGRDVLEALVSAGAALDQGNRQGMTPLMFSAASGNDGAVEKLLALGADVEARDLDGMTAIFYAIQRPAENTAVLDRLLRAGARVEARASRETTPLMVAALHGGAWAVKGLLGAGANAGAEDFIRWTPLHFAARARGGAPFPSYGGEVGELVGSAETECLRLLLSADVTVDARDSGGTTPLMVAAASDNVPAVSLLLEAGADPSLTDRTGRDALGYARLRNARGCAALLEGR